MSGLLSLLGFAEHIGRLIAEAAIEEHEILEHAAKVIEKEAKAEIGNYQNQAGPFSAWAELADSTKRDRVNKGYSDDEPLLRDGDLRDSIEHTVTDHEAHIGSDSPIAEYQELGTDRIPPRSFLGGAAFRKAPEIAEFAGTEMTAFLSGAGVFKGKQLIK